MSNSLFNYVNFETRNPAYLQSLAYLIVKVFVILEEQ